MKKLILLSFTLTLLSCQKDSQLNNSQPNPELSSAVQYLVMAEDPDQVLGIYNGSGSNFEYFDYSQPIVREGRSYQIDQNSIELTGNPNVNTTYLEFVAFDGDGASIKSAVPIVLTGPNFIPIMGVSTCPQETHTCTSDDGKLTFCSSCIFTRNNKNCITGCKCSSYITSICLHSVSATNPSGLTPADLVRLYVKANSTNSSQI